VKGYKGFDANIQCRGFQYTVGVTASEKSASLCNSGLHFCENPLDVFRYYPPADSRFAEIEADAVSDDTDSDSKRVCKKLTVEIELSLKSMVDAGVSFILERVNFSNKSATNTGYQSAATNTGNQSAATNTGNQSAASVSGNGSIACGLGWRNKAMGALGCWIVLAERDNEGEIITVKSALVDGKKIESDTWYTLKNKKFVFPE